MSKIIPGIVSVVIASAGVIAGANYGIDRITNASSVVGSDAISTVFQDEQIIQSSEGQYIGGYKAVIDYEVIPGVRGQIPTLVGGATMSVVAEGQHVVIAQHMANGKYRVASETNLAGVTCDSYTAKCVRRVTSTRALISAVPVFQANS